MFEQILRSLGYDATGNNADLLASGDRRNIRNGRVRSVSAGDVCPACGIVYGSHPQVQGAL